MTPDDLRKSAEEYAKSKSLVDFTSWDENCDGERFEYLDEYVARAEIANAYVAGSAAMLGRVKEAIEIESNYWGAEESQEIQYGAIAALEGIRCKLLPPSGEEGLLEGGVPVKWVPGDGWKIGGEEK